MSSAAAETAAADFSGTVAERLAAMAPWADCTLRSSDGKAFRVHTVKLVEQSSVLRSMLSELRMAELDLEECGADMQLLVAGMYDATLPLTWGRVGPLLELARKYGVRDIERNCELALRATPLTAENLPRVLRLAATYGLDDLAAQCKAAVAAGDMFRQLKRQHGDGWYRDLPAATFAGMLDDHINALERHRDWCSAQHSQQGAAPSPTQTQGGKGAAGGAQNAAAMFCCAVFGVIVLGSMSDEQDRYRRRGYSY